MSFPLASAVMAVYDELAEQLRTTTRMTGLGCPTGCGACCLSPNVQATPLEVLPAVAALTRHAPVEHWLDRLELSDLPCTFYAADPQNPSQGRCQTYETRPLLCRLHGFAARRNKYGGRDFAACRVMRLHQPEVVHAVITQVSQEADIVPMYGDWYARIAGLNPSLGSELLPINQAFAAALRWLGLRLQMGDLTLLEAPIPPDDKQPPTCPSHVA